MFFLSAEFGRDNRNLKSADGYYWTMRGYDEERAPLFAEQDPYSPCIKRIVIFLAAFTIVAIVWYACGSLIRAGYWLTVVDQTTFYIDQGEQMVIGFVFFTHAIVSLWACFRYMVVIYRYYHDASA